MSVAFFYAGITKDTIFFLSLLAPIWTLTIKAFQLNVINVTYSSLCKNFYADCSVFLDKSLTGGGRDAIIAIKKIGNL